MEEGGTNMEQNYTFAALFDYSEEDYINISFPDFEGLITSVRREEDPIMAAQDILTLALVDLESENKKLPTSVSLDEININKKEKMVFINVWMPYHRSKMKEVYVKKTLTIPSWLNILAMNNSINFSETLTKSLKEELKLVD
ncbi:MAG TPA: hypothetical protein VK121_08525 [Pseudogracilibacillus sp.]|nr:hypothetical protein [Pseudogracilibacillus sp.]